MSLQNTLRETDSDGDSIYNCILDGMENIPYTTSRTVITVQPHLAEELSRRSPLPILLGGYTTRARHILPIFGIQLLSDVEELQIQQTIDLNDLYSTVEAPNKYFVKAEDGEIIFWGTEGSSLWQRLFCGSSRRFIMRLFDRARQEALYFIRRLAPSNPMTSFYLQRMDVFIPPCEYIGCVQQIWTPTKITLSIRNYSNETTFQVAGPIGCCGSSQRDIQFEVIGLDTLQTVGVITHKWEESRAVYILSTTYLRRLDYKKKALILACTFLLEYIYFHVDPSGCRLCRKR
uniref:Phospholipid scramblase n=1 Tax=Riptortus pedestris TaxID=329032 RepID=R4WR60_RIPPE|nr:phospholipid scramblase 1 [Riptortus pedestris]